MLPADIASRAPIWRYLRRWWELKPDFFWAPLGGRLNALDWVSGMSASLTGDRPVLAAGGLVNPAYDNSANARMLKWSTNVGLGASTPHIAALLVSGSSASSRGHLFKIGNSSTGWGIAHGSGDDAIVGTSALFLRELLTWHSSANAAWVDGLQVVFCGRSNQGAWYAHNSATGLEATTTSSPFAPSSVLYINGRNDGLSSPFTVHAAALFKWSLTNTGTASTRTLLAERFGPLARKNSVAAIRQLFVPERRRLWAVSAGGGTTHNSSLTESVSATDTVSAILTTSAALEETASLADAVVALLSAVADVSETVAPADSVISVIGLLADLTESTSPTDTLTADLLLSAVVAEAATASDSVTALATLDAVLQETLALSEVASCIATAIAELAETAALTDTVSTDPTITADLTETVSLADAAVAAAARAAAVSEALSLLDTLTATSVRAASLTETLSLIDAVVAVLNGPTTPLERVLLRSRITQAVLERSRVSLHLKLRGKLRH